MIPIPTRIRSRVLRYFFFITVIKVYHIGNFIVLRNYLNPSIHGSPVKTCQVIYKFMQEAVIKSHILYVLALIFAV